MQETRLFFCGKASGRCGSAPKCGKVPAPDTYTGVVHGFGFAHDCINAFRGNRNTTEETIGVKCIYSHITTPLTDPQAVSAVSRAHSDHARRPDVALALDRISPCSETCFGLHTMQAQCTQMHTHMCYLQS